jgi:hypothetical protein
MVFSIAICDLRFAIWLAVRRQRSRRRFPRRGDNRDDLVCFTAQQCDARCLEQLSFNDQFQPIKTFIRFFLDDAKFRQKLSLGTAPARRSIIRSHGCSTSSKLISNNSSRSRIRQCVNQPKNPQRKLLGASNHLSLGHRHPFNRKPQFANRKFLPSRRKTTGDTTAQDRICLGLLPFGPDPVHSRPLHRTRPSSATTDRCIAEYTLAALLPILWNNATTETQRHRDKHREENEPQINTDAHR